MTDPTVCAFLFGDSCGGMEWLVIFVVVMIVFGPKSLPDIARKIGRTLEMFRRTADEFKDQVMRMDEPTPVPYTSRSPYEAADSVSVATDDGVVDAQLACPEDAIAVDVDGVPVKAAEAAGEAAAAKEEPTC